MACGAIPESRPALNAEPRRVSPMGSALVGFLKNNTNSRPAWQEIVRFSCLASRPSTARIGRASEAPSHLCNRVHMIRLLSPTASLRGDGFSAMEIELRRLFRLARMNLNGERHASRAFQEDRFVLDPVGAKDEVGERSVGGDRLTGTAGLREIDDRSRVFGRSVLVALEGEVDEKARRRVAAERAPFGSVDKALDATHEIVGEFPCVFQDRIGFDIGNLELRRSSAPSQYERDNRCDGAKAKPTHSPPPPIREI